MQISKVGEELVIRLPAPLIDALALKEGDEVEIDFHARERIGRASTLTREQALAELDKVSSSLPKLPEGYKFRRQDAYEQ